MVHPTRETLLFRQYLDDLLVQCSQSSQTNLRGLSCQNHLKNECFQRVVFCLSRNVHCSWQELAKELRSHRTEYPDEYLREDSTTFSTDSSQRQTCLFRGTNTRRQRAIEWHSSRAERDPRSSGTTRSRNARERSKDAIFNTPYRTTRKTIRRTQRTRRALQTDRRTISPSRDSNQFIQKTESTIDSTNRFSPRTI